MAESIKYVVEYKKSKVGYDAAALEKVAREYGVYELNSDHDYLTAAVMHFCATHFMCGAAAHLHQYDADTRGDKWQVWQYQPNGCFKGWIYADAK